MITNYAHALCLTHNSIPSLLTDTKGNYGLALRITNMCTFQDARYLEIKTKTKMVSCLKKMTVLSE